MTPLKKTGESKLNMPEMRTKEEIAEAIGFMKSAVADAIEKRRGDVAVAGMEVLLALLWVTGDDEPPVIGGLSGFYSFNNFVLAARAGMATAKAEQKRKTN